MQKLDVCLEHCYGIRKLDHTFDFRNANAYAIYAPNGAMKSSFATVFSDISEGKPSSDRIFAARATKRIVKWQDGSELKDEDVLVVRPYDEVLAHTERTSTLLVNSKLREEYETLHAEIDTAKEKLLSALKVQSNSKKDISKEISLTFTRSDTDLYKALSRIGEELEAQSESPFADIKYDIVFDDKVVEMLGTKDVKAALDQYLRQYNDLISNSVYFKKGIFSYYNAGQIAKSLADNGFFKARHSINLNSNARLEISNESDLEAIIKKEKDGITNDPVLKKSFAAIEKALTKNVNVRNFESYLNEKEEIIPFLANLDQFKEDVWKSYLKSNYELYLDLVEKYRSAEKRRREIEAQAESERTQWEEVIDIFNDRFFVPFRLEAKNRTSVILGQEPILTLGFVFEEGQDRASVARNELLQVLSTGEKKALYILNIIFEIQARLKNGQKTVLVVDDIADSFDYKNKYAIIQYLKDISEYNDFFQIILTHNFDFFRTLESRYVPYKNCLMATKDSTKIELSKASGIRNIFVKDWKGRFHDDARKRIASIPFMRNLIEFTKGEDDPDYSTLTALLHVRQASPSITAGQLFQIYNRLFGSNVTPPDANLSVLIEIEQEAEQCLNAQQGVNFENKIVLAMATRLRAERFMVNSLNDPEFVLQINANQTTRLLSEIRRRALADASKIAILERVVLMTPENIHLNSFMYEPILDMSDDHLRRLFADTAAL